MTKLIAREALYIPVADLKKSLVAKTVEEHTLRFYNDKACNSCEYLAERHSEVCDQCAAFHGGAQLGSVQKINGKKYLKLPAGKQELMERKLGVTRVVDKQIAPADVPMKKPIRFRYKALRPYQKDVVRAIIKHKKGVVKSAPRTGKTVMSSAAIVKLNGRTLILASQRAWLEGFYETFCGSKTQKGFTDAKGPGVSTQEIRDWIRKGRPHRSIGFAKTLEDFKRLDICLCTYQTFLSAKGKKLLRKLRDHFSTVVVDEIHTANADQYALTISALNAQYKIGLSGTPNRKDGRDVIVEHLFGKIFIETSVEQLKPIIHLTKTKFTYDKKMARWDQMLSSLEKNPQRLKLIAKTAIKDVKAGHMVLIPLWRVDAVKALTAAINRMADKKIAAPYFGGVPKDTLTKTVEAARKYKVKILVGNAKMISTGLNIPRASMLYESTLSSNPPNAEQRFKRVLTPYEGKPEPGIRYFLDDMSVRKRCMSNEFWHAMMKEVKPKFRANDFENLKAYFSNSKSTRMEL